ncbi:polysaccharide pyruvyl transferase family protein [Lachnospiraceae bacterium OttesenSCG-928-D06]|nr:polysaccharide pyruvyl transferase family protein [Lachnospiraceae bacterium OttesenSCG-928-D06]
MEKHYDIGVYGWWGHANFGGCLTYFALEKVLEKMGYTVLMIQEVLGFPGRYKIPNDSIAMRFANKHYHCSPQVNVKELNEFNKLCDKFIVGGDQMWNYLIPFVKEDCFLNFVNSDKLKISYSTSFGTTHHNPPESFLHSMAPLLQKFDCISVREDYGVEIAKKLYGVNATQVIDAVFLLDKEDYIEASADYTVNLPEEYLLAFILNPTAEKRTQIEIIANKLGLQILCIPDAASAYHKSFFEIFEGLEILSPLSLPNFIMAYANSKYVITDSFHGTCMSYVFKKDFSVYFNEQRGADRFISLMKILNLDMRRINETQTSAQLLENEKIAFNVDWSKADENVKREKDFSWKWLKKALDTPVFPSMSDKITIVQHSQQSLKDEVINLHSRLNEQEKLIEQQEELILKLVSLQQTLATENTLSHRNMKSIWEEIERLRSARCE